MSACCADAADQTRLRALALADWPPAQVPAGAGGLQQLRGLPLRGRRLLHPGVRPSCLHRPPAPTAAGCPYLLGPAQAQLAASECQGCAAPSLDLCSAFASNRIVVAIAVRRPRLINCAVLSARTRLQARLTPSLWMAAGRSDSGKHGGAGGREPGAAGAAGGAAGHALGAAGGRAVARAGAPGAAGPGPGAQPASCVRAGAHVCSALQRMLRLLRLR